MEDMKAIFKQAADEQLIENTLKNVEEVWFSKRFQFDDYHFLTNYEYLNRQQAELDYLITAFTAAIAGRSAQSRRAVTSIANSYCVSSGDRLELRGSATPARQVSSLIALALNSARALAHFGGTRASGSVRGGARPPALRGAAR